MQVDGTLKLFLLFFIQIQTALWPLGEFDAKRCGGQGYHADKETGKTEIAVEINWKPNLVWKRNIRCIKEPKWGFKMKNEKVPELVDAVISRGKTNRKTEFSLSILWWYNELKGLSEVTCWSKKNGVILLLIKIPAQTTADWLSCLLCVDGLVRVSRSPVNANESPRLITWLTLLQEKSNIKI